VAGQEGCGEAKAAARRHFCFFSFFLLFSGSKMRLHYLFVRHFIVWIKSNLWEQMRVSRGSWPTCHSLKIGVAPCAGSTCHLLLQKITSKNAHVTVEVQLMSLFQQKEFM
jgi:hypothetical protein